MASPRTYPPFHLDAAPEDLESLGRGPSALALVLSGYRPDDTAGARADAVWLKGTDGTVWWISVGQRDLEFKFEVFNLTVKTAESLRDQREGAPRPIVPDGAPAWGRAIAAAPRAVPAPPEEFEPLPFVVDRLAVLRRSEYILSRVPAGSTFGDVSNWQGAADPAGVPPEAEATCVVSVGLLLSGGGTERLLIGADWHPFSMVVTQHADVIDDYVAACEAVDIRAYADMLRAPTGR